MGINKKTIKCPTPPKKKSLLKLEFHTCVTNLYNYPWLCMLVIADYQYHHHRACSCIRLKWIQIKSSKLECDKTVLCVSIVLSHPQQLQLHDPITQTVSVSSAQASNILLQPGWPDEASRERKIWILSMLPFIYPAQWINQYRCMWHAVDRPQLFISCCVLKWILTVDHTAGAGGGWNHARTLETEK